MFRIRNNTLMRALRDRGWVRLGWAWGTFAQGWFHCGDEDCCGPLPPPDLECWYHRMRRPTGMSRRAAKRQIHACMLFCKSAGFQVAHDAQIDGRGGDFA
jgi:hypothetical protein